MHMEQQTEVNDKNQPSKDNHTFYDNITGVLRRTKNEGERSTKSRENCKAMVQKSCKSGSYKWVKCLLFFVYMVISNSIISHTVTQL